MLAIRGKESFCCVFLTDLEPQVSTNLASYPTFSVPPTPFFLHSSELSEKENVMD